ncbi:MAG: hypothetical protein IPJ08_18400 [Burkholderiales bacterium]|nr:hypothetical protein [Burkholderiales bacterium]
MEACPAKFALGQVVITRPALALAESHGIDVIDLVRRHASGDWGDLGGHDKVLNEAALSNGSRIFSAYDVQGERWYVITEWDRSYTTVMLSSAY